MMSQQSFASTSVGAIPSAAISFELPSALVAPLTDNQHLIEMISDVLQLPRDEVGRLLYEEEMSLGAYQRRDADRWGIEPGVWNAKLIEFYKNTNMGIFGNPVWNRRAEKLELRGWIGRYLRKISQAPLDVLTVGDGSGFDSLYLALCGHRVTYSEESHASIAFARRMFTESNVPVRITDDLAKESQESFDVVVCLDVLEHVPDPPAFVKQLTGYLRPGGRLIVHAPFFFVGYLNPTHLSSNRKYSGDLNALYSSNGLRLVDGRFWWDPIVLAKPGPHPVCDRTSRITLLKISGLVLALARWWNWPHCRVATRAMQKREPRWLKGLEP